MNQSVIYKTDNGNYYLYNNEYGLTMVLSPVFIAIYKGESHDPYYEKKYSYLRSHGFFSKFYPNMAIKIDEKMIKDSIMQVPQIVFEMTEACNLNCTYCALGELYNWTSQNKKRGKKLNVDSAIKLINYIFNLRVHSHNKKVSISFYGGEPLLNMNCIKKIVNYAKTLGNALNLEVNFNMTTNGLLLHKYIDFVVKNRFNLLVSLDGDEKNNSYRVLKSNGNPSFQQVVSNLEMIQNVYPTFFEHNISFNSVLHDKNSVKQIYEYIYKKFHKTPLISELNTLGVNRLKEDIFRSMFRSRFQSEMEYTREKNNIYPHEMFSAYYSLIDFLKYLSVNSSISDVSSLFSQTMKFYPANTCVPFSKKIFLTVDDKLLACERISYKYVLGEIKENVDLDFANIAHTYTHYYERLQNVCSQCYLYKFCGICLFYLNNMDKNISGSFACEYSCDEGKFSNRLSELFSFIEKYPNDVYEILENLVIEK